MNRLAYLTEEYNHTFLYLPALSYLKRVGSSYREHEHLWYLLLNCIADMFSCYLPATIA